MVSSKTRDKAVRGKRPRAGQPSAIKAKPKSKANAPGKTPASRRTAAISDLRNLKTAGGKTGKSPKPAAVAGARPAVAGKGRESSSHPLAVVPAPRLLRESKATAGALAMLEKGIKYVHQKEFKKARAEMKSLIESHPGEPEILATARSYIQICDREEAAHKKPASGHDQLYALGVIEHNRGNYDGAIAHFRHSLDQHQDAEYVYYSLAASLTQNGNPVEAIQMLRKAIELNEDNRVYAKNDQDFAALHANREFTDLVGMAPPASPTAGIG